MGTTKVSLGLTVGLNFETLNQTLNVTFKHFRCLLNVWFKVKALSQTGNYNGNGMKVCSRIFMSGTFCFHLQPQFQLVFPRQFWV